MAKTVLEEKFSFSYNICMPRPSKFTTALELKEIPVQECFMSNLEPLIQKDVIYQIQWKTLSDSVQSATIHYISKGKQINRQHYVLSFNRFKLN